LWAINIKITARGWPYTTSICSWFFKSHRITHIDISKVKKFNFSVFFAIQPLKRLKKYFRFNQL
jgi:hypothetical protein